MLKKLIQHVKFLRQVFEAQPYTGQGTLYPPHSISEKAFQKEIVMEICPYVDDL